MCETLDSRARIFAIVWYTCDCNATKNAKRAKGRMDGFSERVAYANY